MPNNNDKKIEEKGAEATVKKEIVQPSSNNKNVIIAVLATVLGCLVLMFAILAATGVIKFGGTSDGSGSTSNTGGKNDDTGKTNGGNTANGGGTTQTDDDIINNPNRRVSVNGTLVEVDELSFYLPSQFESGGKNSDGAYTYNLTDDDGWAQVLVYSEKSSKTPQEFLLSKSPYLDITDDDYEMNGTEWVEGETGSMLAYATELDGRNYAIIYAVKLDSDATSEAMSMIPKTLYMKRIYKD